MKIVSPLPETLLYSISIIFFSGSLSHGMAQPHSPVFMDSLFQAAIVATVNQDYERALIAISEAIGHDPEEPLGHLFRAATLQSRMLDYENDADEAAFIKSLKSCRQLAEKKLRKNSKNAQAHFALGSAYGYEAFYVGKKKRYWEAAHLGWKTIQHLETAIALDPEMYDAYLAIGTYKYYRSKMKLFFLGDESAEGLALVRKAAVHGKYSNYAAINGLTWMLLDENRAEEAYALSDSVLQKFPGSRFFLWGAAESAARLQKFARARACYLQIMSSLEQEQKLSPYLEAVCRLKLARLDLRESKNREACAQLDLIDGKKLPAHAKGREAARQVEQLRKSCKGLETASSNGGRGGQ